MRNPIIECSCHTVATTEGTLEFLLKRFLEDHADHKIVFHEDNHGSK